AGIGELAHLHIGAAVAQHLDALGTGARMAGTIHHEVGAEAADDVANTLDALIRLLDLLDVHRRLGAEFARELKPRRFATADADHPSGAHFARGGDGENADRSRALDHHRVPPSESTGADRAVERADAGGQRLR